MHKRDVRVLDDQLCHEHAIPELSDQPLTTDTIHGSSIANLKELQPGTVRDPVRLRPSRDSILLVASDRAGRWKEWVRWPKNAASAPTRRRNSSDDQPRRVERRPR